MRVKCRINDGRYLSKKYFAASRPESERTVYHVSIGKEYQVFAMGLWHSVLILLLIDDTNKPNWYGIELFSVADGHVPANWQFSTSTANEAGVEAIWGYERLVSDPQHYEALIERDPAALEAFAEEKLRMSDTAAQQN
jgi:hypothetical protein